MCIVVETLQPRGGRPPVAMQGDKSVSSVFGVQGALFVGAAVGRAWSRPSGLTLALSRSPSNLIAPPSYNELGQHPPARVVFLWRIRCGARSVAGAKMWLQHVEFEGGAASRRPVLSRPT
jgi:hypothetical protein